MSSQSSPNLVFGTIDAMIGDVFEKVPLAFSGGDIVITFIDSTPVIGAMSLEFLEKHEIKYEVGVAALRVHESTSMKFMNLESFEGFDEMFIVKAGSSLAPYSSAALLPPTYHLQTNIPDKYLALFEDAGALRYYSDGAGLHYGVESEVAQLLNRAFPTKESQGRLF